MLTTNTHPSFQTPIDNQIDGITVNTDAVIKDLLNRDRPLLEIAANQKLNLQQLIVWCDQPAVRALLDAADELALRRAASTAAHAQHGALTVLNEQALNLHETPKAKELASKACRALLRAFKSHSPAEQPDPMPIDESNPTDENPDRQPSRPARLSKKHKTRKHPATNPLFRIPVFPFNPQPRRFTFPDSATSNSIPGTPPEAPPEAP